MGREDLGAQRVKGEERGAPDLGGARPLILVAVDDQGALSALGAALSRHYRVVLRSSAADAVAGWDPETSAVILDVKMRDQGGFWACDEIKKKSAEVPVIFYAASQDITDPLDIIHQHQPFGYITKSTDTSAVKQTLDHAIRYHQVIAENKRVVAELQQMRARMQGLTTSIK